MVALSMEMKVNGEGGGEVEEEGEGTQRSLVALDFLTQDSDTSGSTC